jgi:hypothetical protein
MGSPHYLPISDYSLEEDVNALTTDGSNYGAFVYGNTTSAPLRSSIMVCRLVYQSGVVNCIPQRVWNTKLISSMVRSRLWNYKINLEGIDVHDIEVRWPHVLFV